ncbi:MAG: gliding motility-associated C-terminal domain-containing protein [Runella slithyformis]|nr:MAG: gliding motility-associated C-terminal domain-containing protein [Runella slithyformis]TAH14673.1 MAG: gliding motility-associated C-terminal domain-containing protein [Runella slithyformis]
MSKPYTTFLFSKFQRLFSKAAWGIICCYFGFISFGFSQQIANNQCTDVNVLSGSMGMKATVGCMPFAASAFNTLKGATNHRYIFDYQGGAPSNYKTTTDSNYTYPKAGIYVVMQLGEKDGRATRSCATVTVQDTTPPVIRLQLCVNGLATLTLPSDPANKYDDYGIQWGDGNGEIINKQTRVVTHRYTDQLPKQVRVQGIHKYGKCGGSTVRTISAKQANEPPTLTKLAITDANTAELTIDNPSENGWLLYRQEATDPFASSGKTIRMSKETVKVLIDTNQITCFKLMPTDTCSAQIESNVLCISYLKATGEGALNRVSVAPYRYPSEALQRTVLKNNAPWWKANATEFSRDDTDPSCNNKTCYQLKVETEKGVVLSNVACLPPPPVLCNLLGNVFIPDAFTPNGDGFNDLLEIKGELSQGFKWLIYNQWGSIIFSSTDPKQGWNGQQNGQPAVPGAYFYRLDMLDKAKRTFSKRGSFLLIR